MACDDTVLAILDILCPMHVVLDDTGHIYHAGPTLAKLRPETRFDEQRFLEIFELLRPRSVNSMQELLKCAGVKLHLRLRDVPRTGLKGVLVPLADGRGAVLNLSFGISILDGVRDYALTSADFAATDLAVEMLYLVEAKSAAMEASRQLNLRLQAAMIAAEEQAFTDTLTGLKNRRAMDHVLSRMLESQTEFALMHLDLDFFKTVNDTMGHAAGDHVLQEVAKTLVAETRSDDTTIRVGGDEFILIINELSDKEQLDSIARRVISQLERPIMFNGSPCRISASIGTALSTDFENPSAEQIIKDADAALYASKRQGRAQHTFFDKKLHQDGFSAA